VRHVDLLYWQVILLDRLSLMVTLELCAMHGPWDIAVLVHCSFLVLLPLYIFVSRL
jgi:hypothetical protein